MMPSQPVKAETDRPRVRSPEVVDVTGQVNVCRPINNKWSGWLETLKDPYLATV
jgi:hypothetical protein